MPYDTGAFTILVIERSFRPLVGSPFSLITSTVALYRGACSSPPPEMTMQRAAASLCLALAAGQSVASLDNMRAARIHSAITNEDTSGVYVDTIPMPTPGEGEASQATRRTPHTAHRTPRTAHRAPHTASHCRSPTGAVLRLALLTLMAAGGGAVLSFGAVLRGNAHPTTPRHTRSLSKSTPQASIRLTGSWPSKACTSSPRFQHVPARQSSLALFRSHHSTGRIPFGRAPTPPSTTR